MQKEFKELIYLYTYDVADKADCRIDSFQKVTKAPIAPMLQSIGLISKRHFHAQK